MVLVNSHAISPPFALSPHFGYTLLALTTVLTSQIRFAIKGNRSPKGWVFLLFICLVAAFLRVWQLDSIPAGLYRDEAFNGLDALNLLDGAHALFFPANNGREPAYIYLTALNVALWGKTAWAVRFTAALSGTLTTYVVYLLSKSWWRNETIGLLSAWLWATTVWPIHLSRIGLRPILLIPLFTLALWLATQAYRRRHNTLWFLAGIVYGLGFYTYLASRLTPAFLLVAIVWLWWTQRQQFPALWRGLLWAGLGLTLTLIPWALLALNQPDILLGRTGQVSILHPDINGGNMWGALAESVARSLGLFLWQGDTILRHNPAGRPLFDLVMAIPFLIGLVWCLRHWRKTAPFLTLSWIAVMLLGTILAEDPPHFLRAIGILPAALFLPALGLWQIGSWFGENQIGRQLFIGLLLISSLSFTLYDYFGVYGQDPNTGYLFETAARQLAEEVNTISADQSVILEKRFWDGWPSVQFLLNTPDHLTILSAEELSQVEPEPAPEIAFYLWPHDPAVWSQVGRWLQPDQTVSAVLGAQARGDLEPAPYPLSVRYMLSETKPTWLNKTAVPFVSPTGQQAELHGAQRSATSTQQLTVDLVWAFNSDNPVTEPIVTFVQVIDSETGQLIGQQDTLLAQGYIPPEWWGEGRLLHEQKLFDLSRPLTATDEIVVGIYPAGQAENRFLIAPSTTQTVWNIPPANMNTD